jgi:hypothetical protein
MTDAVAYVAFGALVALAAILALVRFQNRRSELLAHAVGGVGAIGEALVALEHELHKANGLLEAGQGGDTVRTRLTDMEAKIQTSQMVVADAVEKVTSLSSRLQKRVSRAQQERGLLDEDEEPELPPAERAAALKALAGAGLTVAPGHGPRESQTPVSSSSGWDRVRHNAARKRAAEG